MVCQYLCAGSGAYTKQIYKIKTEGFVYEKRTNDGSRIFADKSRS